MRGVLSVIISLWAFFGVVFGEGFDAKYVNSLKGSDGIVRLTDKTFDKVVGGPRDYAVAVF